MKKIYTLLLIGIFIGSGLQVNGLQNNIDTNIETQSESYQLNDPIVQDDGQFVSISFDELSSTLRTIGNPEIPVLTRILSNI